MELEVLNIWPDWKAVRLIGEGSFGKVYEITRNNFSIEEHCALKVISIPSSDAELESMRNEGMDDESITTYYKGMVEEFVNEIALMSKLKGNNHIVGYEDYAVIERKDTIGWNILIRMELLTPLPAYLRNRPVTETDVITLSIDLCTALETCFRERVIHRDIKLDNIFVSKDNKFKLGDFGVARTIEKTVSGLSKKGTYTYMAPEVYKGEAYGTNVDIYSLGIVMYKLLNNNREPFLPPHPQPITHTSKNDALVKRLSGQIIPPPANANEYLQRIVLKCCNFVSKNRYQTPMQLKADLIAVKNSKVTGVAPVLQLDQIARSVTNTTAQKQTPSAPATNRGTVPPSVRPQQAVNTNTSYRTNNQSVRSVTPAAQPVYAYKQHAGTVRPVNVAPQQTKADKTKKKFTRNYILFPLALIVGYIGAVCFLFELFDMMYAEFNFVYALLTAVSMLLLTIRAWDRIRIPVAVFMFIMAVVSQNYLCVAAAVIFICMKRTK